LKTLIARKIGMTQLADEQGRVTPATLLFSDSCVVTQIKDQQKDGYRAVQIGYGHRQKINKPLAGHLKHLKMQPAILREFTLLESDDQLKVGTIIDLDQFAVGEKVRLSATSKGKGFAGTVKRHNFHRGPVTHGSQNVRKPGSIGSMYPQKIIKGKRMAGRMGHRKVTLKNREIIYLDKSNHIIGIRGPVPGPRKSLVCIEGQ